MQRHQQRSEQGLPVNTNAEQCVLGAIILDHSLYPQAAGSLKPDDFSLEKHRRIFARMGEIHSRGEIIDRITIANELHRCGELESCDGLSYLVSLDDGLPQIPNLDSYTNIIRDKATLRQIIVAAQNLQNRCMLAEEDPGQLLAEANSSFLTIAERGQESSLQTPQQIIDGVGGVNVYLDRRNRTTGTGTGFHHLDLMIGGFKASNLYILAARPAMGKTALAVNIASAVGLEQGMTVPVFSLEMDKESLIDRMVCSRSRVDAKRFESGFISEEERKRLGKITVDIMDSGKILIDDRANTNTAEIHSKIRKQQARGPVGLVVLDYLQLLIDGDDEHRVAACSRITRELKLIAKDCKVPFLALSQLSRKCEERTDKRPILSDLRESGTIEQDADVVVMLYRGEVYYPDRPELRGEAELIVRKQRGGPIGTVPLTWLGEIVRFEGRAGDHGAPPPEGGYQ